MSARPIQHTLKWAKIGDAPERAPERAPEGRVGFVATRQHPDGARWRLDLKSEVTARDAWRWQVRFMKLAGKEGDPMRFIKAQREVLMTKNYEEARDVYNNDAVWLLLAE